MGNELRHKSLTNSVLPESTNAGGWEHVGTHILNSQTARDIIYASSATQLSRLGAGTRGLGGCITVAASNASAGALALADYVCDGTADDVEIQAAIDALSTTKGTVVLSEGTFNINADIAYPVSKINLIGQGAATTLKAVTNNINILNNGNSYVAQFCTFGNFVLDGYTGTTTGAIAMQSNSLQWSHLLPIWINNFDADVAAVTLKSEATDGGAYSNNWVYNKSDALYFYTVGYALNIQGKSDGTKVVCNSQFDLIYGENISVWGLCIAHYADTLHFGEIIFGLGANNAIGVMLNYTDDDADKGVFDIVIDRLTVGNQASGTWTGQRGIQPNYGKAGYLIVYVPYYIPAGTMTAVESTKSTGHKIYVASPLAGWNLLNSTENSGTATVANGQTSVTVTHGLAATPTRVYLTPTNSMGLATNFWVNTLTTTQFTINVNTNPGATTAIFNWRAIIGEGN